MKRDPVPTFNDTDIIERLDEYRAFVAMVQAQPKVKRKEKKRGHRR